jgi:hypothetical protein
MKGTPNTRGLPGIKKTKLISVIFAAFYVASDCLDVASSFFFFCFGFLCVSASFSPRFLFFDKVPKQMRYTHWNWHYAFHSHNALALRDGLFWFVTSGY